MSDKKDDEIRGQSAWTVFRSVGASFLGVQSSTQHKEDFAKGKISSYIIAGLIGTLIFILVVFGIVQLVMSLAT